MLNLLGAALYFVTVAACAFAALAPRARSAEKRGHRTFWLLACVFFLALAAARLTGLEELVRQYLRGLLASNGEYGIRREIQAPLAAAVVTLLGGIAAIVTMRRSNHRKRPHQKGISMARWAVAGMAGLVMLRLTSFHATDALLHGKLHLNWILDPLLALMAATGAFFYARAN